MNKEEIWQAVLGNLEVTLSKANFTTWFKDTFIVDIQDSSLIVGVPSAFAKEWLENKYTLEVKNALKKVMGKDLELEYRVAQAKTMPLKAKEETVTLSTSAPADGQAFGLSPQYTFDKFIVGNSNRLAFATAVAVAQKPGNAHNPLFIYGGVGLGKTHLIQAIGQEILKRFSSKKVLYTPAERFTNEFIQSIAKGRMEEFKKTYRDIDVLLIDDIQFLSQKEGTQEEFFHTFNALHQKACQIVMTADRLPKAIPALEERLSSRFGWGMVADIQPPNLEMRYAILRQKCQEKGISNIPEEVINYIAQNIQKNIRDLEGALNRLVTFCELHAVKPSLETTSHALEGLLINAQIKNLTVEKVLKIVSQFFNLKEEEILNKKRTKEVVYPRQVIMYLLRSELNLSFPRIGEVLGGKDHTTIMHGCSKIEKERAKNESTAKEITTIKEILYQVGV